MLQHCGKTMLAGLPVKRGLLRGCVDATGGNITAAAMSAHSRPYVVRPGSRLIQLG